MYDMFRGCSSLASLDLSGFDTSKVADMDGMFKGCSLLGSIKFPAGFGPACTNMSDMFYGCTSLASLDLSGFDTSEAMDMDAMFEGCSSLESVVFPAGFGSACTNMSDMFYGCLSLASLDLSGSDTSKVADMDAMFDGCSSLLSVEFPAGFGSACTNMSDMFLGCSSLAYLDLSGFDMSKVVDSDYMLCTYGYISVTVGSECVLSSDARTLPATYFTGSTGKWVSKADGNAYTAAAIAASRSRTPDTYTTEMQPVFRLSGGDRYKTMQEVVKSAGFAKYNTTDVVLASGQNFPDALSASALAGMLHAPVVLTEKGALTAEATGVIDSIRPSTVYMVGGTAAMSKDVEDALAARGNVKVVRIAGDDRVKTAEAVCEQGASSWGKTCVVAYSDSFADALSMAPFAYAAKAPILLADVDSHELVSSTLAEIRKCGFTSAVIVGGTNAVKPDVEAQLESAGIQQVKRLGGVDRYDTSRIIAEYAVAQGVLSYRGAAVVTGKGFADALSAGAVCGRSRSVLLLASSEDGGYKAIDGIIGAHASDVVYCRVIGGTSAVNNVIYSHIEQMMQ